VKTRKATGSLFVALLLALAGADTAFGQFTINVQGPNPNMVITTGTPAGGPTPVINTNSRLRYRRWLVTSKITVSTSCPGQSFNLSVFALNPTIGNAAPEVNLVTGMPAMNFITDILPGLPTPGITDLRYTASATYSQGHSIDFGNDVHTVTYTVLAQ
jgi:hypothetical protein